MAGKLIRPSVPASRTFSFVSGSSLCVLCGQSWRPVLSGGETVALSGVEAVARLGGEAVARLGGETIARLGGETVGKGATFGICEPCAVYAYWRWRDEPGEVPPGWDAEGGLRVARVRVLVPRLRAGGATTDRREGETVQPVDLNKSSPGVPEFYDFLMTTCDGGFDLPGVDRLGSQKDEDAAQVALGNIGIRTWPRFVEPLYCAYTPRGQMTAVMLVTAWTLKEGFSEPQATWKKWPIDKHAPSGLAGLYAAMWEVLRLRLFKYQQQAIERPGGLSIQLREVASKYLELQKRLRDAGGDPEKLAIIDTSMMPVLRKSMSSDELWVVKSVLSEEGAQGDLVKQRQQVEVDESLSSALDDSNEDDSEEEESDDEIGSNETASDDGSEGRGDGSEGDESDDDSEGDTSGDDGVGKSLPGRAGERVATSLPIVRSSGSPSTSTSGSFLKARSSEDDESEDDNDWPTDLPLIATATRTTKAPEGFVRRGSPLTTEKVPK